METRTGLWNLANDILADIFFGPHASFLVVTLWKCGSIQLNAKLAQAITSIDLKDTRINSLSRYPILLSSLRNLRELSIERGYYELFSSKDAFLTEISKLEGSKLTSLTLNSREVGEFWTQDFTARTPQSSRPSSVLNLSELLPHLTQLTLDSPGTLHYPITFLPKLPPNLTALTLPRMTISGDTSPIFSQLPRSLTTFTTDMKVSPTSGFFKPDINVFATRPLTSSEFGSELVRVFSDAPLQLRKLSTVALEFEPSFLTTDFIPKSLQEFEASFTGSFRSKWTTEDLNRLPSCWSTLFITNTDLWRDMATSSEWTQFLPSRLTRLSIIISLAENHSFELHKLPASLTYLDFIGITSYVKITIDWDGLLASPSSWPPALSTFNLGITIPKKALLALPPMLTSLSCHWNEKEPFPVPVGLNRLSIVGPGVTLVDSRSVSLINAPKAASAVPQPIAGPPAWHSITELKMHSSRPTISQLPHRLQALIVSGWDIKDFVHLPRTLERLAVRALEGDFDEAGGNIFKHLPRKLVALDLAATSIHPQNLSAQCFSHLPSLTHLKVTQLQFESALLLTLKASTPYLTLLQLQIWCDNKAELDAYRGNLPPGLKTEKVTALHR